MPHTIFFSWQVDRAAHAGRDLIEQALKLVVGRISQDATVEKAIRDLKIDHDTKGVPGSPPIVDTIFRKIDKAAVFVPDLTFVGQRADGRPTPNPNVMIEYGWALKSLSYPRIVPVMNTAFGKPTANSMPFDMGHLRHPTLYQCPDNVDNSGRVQVIEDLAKELEREIRAVLESEEFTSAQPKPPEPAKFVPRQPVDGRARFKAAKEAIGIAHDFLDGPREIFLSERPACWFRLWPEFDPGKTWTVDEVEKAMKPFVYPLSRSWQGYDLIRGADGYGTFGVRDKSNIALAVVFGFITGEIWTVDTFWLDLHRDAKKGESIIPVQEAEYRSALLNYGEVLSGLGVKPPYRWNAGMENLKGRVLYAAVTPGYMRSLPRPDGKCLDDVVTESGTYSPGDAPGPTLKPFFAKLYNNCGLSRQDWQDA